MNDIKALRRYYAAQSDAALLESYARGKGAYELAAWKVIAAEMEARALDPSAPKPRPARSEPRPEVVARPTLSAADAHTQMNIGIGIAAAGAILTIAGYTTTDSGGTFSIWWGAIVYGLVRAVRGAAALDRAKAWDARERLANGDGPALPDDVAAELRQLEEDYAKALAHGADRYLAKQSFDRQAAALRAHAQRAGP